MRLSTAIKLINTLFNFFDGIIYNRIEKLDSKLEDLYAQKQALVDKQVELDAAYEEALQSLIDG